MDSDGVGVLKNILTLFAFDSCCIMKGGVSMMTLFIFYALMAIPAGMYAAYIFGHNDTVNIAIDCVLWPIMAVIIGWVVMKNYVKELTEYTPEQAKKYRNSKEFRH